MYKKDIIWLFEIIVVYMEFKGDNLFKVFVF